MYGGAPTMHQLQGRDWIYLTVHLSQRMAFEPSKGEQGFIRDELTYKRMFLIQKVITGAGRSFSTNTVGISFGANSKSRESWREC